MLDTLRASPRTPTISTFLEALRRSTWHAQAACAGPENVFLSDLSLGQGRFLASPKVLLALLICNHCAVLAESLRRVRVDLGEDAATEAPVGTDMGTSTSSDAVRPRPTHPADQRKRT